MEGDSVEEEIVQLKSWESVITQFFNEKIKSKKVGLSIADWLDWAAENATSVSFATHVPKLTHSKIDSHSLIDSVDDQKLGVVCTASLYRKIIDGAVAGNQFSPIYQFLELECGNQKLLEAIQEMGSEIFNFASESNEQRMRWFEAIKEIGIIDRLATHSLSKQVYFPVNQQSSAEKYHLLSVMMSSSLIQTLHEKNTEAKEANESKRKQKFNQGISINLPNRMSLMVTQSNHSNASQLNGKRGGRLSLLNTTPPHWQSQLKPPVNKSSLFYDDRIYTQTRDDIDGLKSMLLTFDKAGISCWEPNRLRGIENWVKAIADDILDYASLIHTLDSGWSSDEAIKLKREHCYFLDPYRQDVAFKQSLIAGEWQAIVCQDFANWLNYRLVFDKQITLSDKHTKTWMRVFEPILRNFFDGLMLASEEQ
jgi:CRISPR-associated protein Csy1